MDPRRTPLYDLHLEHGGRMVPFAGFEMPVQYEGVLKEHETVRTAGGLFDVSHMGEVFFRGPGAIAAVNHLVTNDVSVLVDGQAQYNAVCNEAGGVVDDVVVYRFGPEEVMICVNASNREKDFAWFVSHTDRTDVEIVDEGDAWCQLAVQGRLAASVLAGLADADVAALGNYRFTRATVAGVEGCVVARTGYTGEDGFEVFAPASAGPALWKAILKAGGGAIAPIGLGARDTLRLEARYCLYGHELNDETSPLQAGLGWITALKKAEFVGREALLARKGKEARRLVGLVLEGKRIAREGMDVVHEGEVVGTVTSGTRSPTLGVAIALAYVRADLTQPGTALTVDVRGRDAHGSVVKGPFFKRDY
jgi:aminomethyltransferase